MFSGLADQPNWQATANALTRSARTALARSYKPAASKRLKMYSRLLPCWGFCCRSVPGSSGIASTRIEVSPGLRRVVEPRNGRILRNFLRPKLQSQRNPRGCYARAARNSSNGRAPTAPQAMKAFQSSSEGSACAIRSFRHRAQHRLIGSLAFLTQSRHGRFNDLTDRYLRRTIAEGTSCTGTLIQINASNPR